METKTFQDILQTKIHDLLHTVIQAYNTKENDVVTLKTIKLFAVGKVLEEFGIDWDHIFKLFKTHTPIHPSIAKELSQCGDEETACILSQIFVPSEKLSKLVKKLSQNKLNMERILAVDGLAGNIMNGPNFEFKHYIGNLRFANASEPKFYFDEETDFRRLHVQTVRKMYQMLKDTPAPAKHAYDILRKCFYQEIQAELPEMQFKEDEEMDGDLETEIGIMYMETMGKDNMDKLLKSLRYRVEKRHAAEMEAAEEDCPAPKKS